MATDRRQLTVPLSGWPGLPDPRTLAAIFVLAGFLLFLFPIDRAAAVFALAAAALVSAPGTTETGERLRLHLPWLGVFVTATFVSIALSIHPEKSLGIGLTLIPALLIFVVTARVFDPARHLVPLGVSAAVLTLATTALVLYGAPRVPRNAPTLIVEGFVPHFALPNDCALLAVMMPFSLAAAAVARTRRIVLLSAASLVAAVVTGVVLLSRTGLVALAAGVATFAVLALPRHRGRSLAVCAVFFLALLALTDGLLGFPLSVKSAFWGDSGRLELWGAAWDDFLAFPAWGTGPDTFGFRHEINWPHNLFLEVLAGHGLVAFVGFLGLIAVSLRCAGASCKTCPMSSAALAGALVAFMGSAFFELTLRREWAPLTLFALAGVSAALLTHDEKESR